MNRRIFFLILFGVVVVINVASPSRCQSQPNSARAQASLASSIARRSSNSLSLISVSTSGTPQVLRGNPAMTKPIVAQSERLSATAIEQAAGTYVASQVLPLLELSPLATASAVATNQVGNTWHSAFQVSYNGIVLRDRMLHVHIGADNGKIVLIRSNIPASTPTLSAPSFDETTALATAVRAYSKEYGTRYSLTQAPLLIFVCLPGPDDITLAYETILSDGFHEWRYTIDAGTGAILQKLDMVVCNFSMEPAATPSSTLADEADTTTTISNATTSVPALALDVISGRITATVHPTKPSDSLVTVPLAFASIKINDTIVVTDANGLWKANTDFPATIITQLTGPRVQVFRKNGPSAYYNKTFQDPPGGPIDIQWDDSNSYAEERDAFYSVNTACEHIVAIDPMLTNIKEKVFANVNIDESCNAFFSAFDKSLNFFIKKKNCNNTAMVADVVYHEFGHRVNFMRYQEAGKSTGLTDRALDEGFADISSNFLRDNPTIGNGFYSNSTAILRTSENTKKWPKDINSDEHITGMIITGAIWDLRKAIGLPLTEALFTKMQYQAPDGNGSTDVASMKESFLDVLMAFLISDDDNNDLTDGTPNAAAILKAFDLHNIGIQHFFDLNITPIADADGFASSYPVEAQVTYRGPVGGIDPESVKLFFTTDLNKPDTAISLYQVSGSTFVGAIPRMPQNSIVRYYLSAATTYGDAGTAIFPMYRSESFAFLVGFDSKFVDHCEDEAGWQFGLPDEGIIGQWTMDDPHPTLNSGAGIFVQQDTDHTAEGNRCLITGNKATDDPNEDAVLDGSKTLTSPEYSLEGIADPVIRYWYYYSNDVGSSGETALWKTQYSVNGGTTWKALQTTTLCTKGWKPYVFKLKEVGPATVQLRWIATDSVPLQMFFQPAFPIVEAGVDDIEILSAAALVDKVEHTNVSSTSSVYPNPAERGQVVTIEDLPFTYSTKVTYSLYNSLGQIIQTSELASSTTIPIPTAIATGVYQVVLSDGQTTVHRKIEVW